MENIIISIIGIAILVSVALFLSRKKTEKTAVKSPIKNNIAEYPVFTSGSGSLKSAPLGTTGKKKSSKKSEFPIDKVNKKSETTKPGAKRGKKPKKDKGNDLLLS